MGTTLPEPAALRDVWEADLQDERLAPLVDPPGEARLAALMREGSIPTSPRRQSASGSGLTFTCRTG